MKKCKYNKIYVLCPAGVKTGGTELLHQLVYQLNRQGAKAYLVYKNNVDRNITESFEEYIDSWIQIEDIEDIKENLLQEMVEQEREASFTAEMQMTLRSLSLAEHL